MIEETSQARVGLRRYAAGSSCPLPWGYHDATVYLGDAGLTWYDQPPEACGQWTRGRGGQVGVPDFTWPAAGDPRWPAACGCGYLFTPGDHRQDWWERLYQRPGGGQLMTLRDAPDGAMWDAWYYPWKGPDGRAMMVKCPGGSQWEIDGRASNCTLPGDNEHRCWIRHGEPPGLTVDKAGVTCSAGAGSIQAGNYHGFLRNGIFDP
jgi:hypothetical protein